VERSSVEWVRKWRSSVWRDVLLNSGDWGDASCVLLGMSSIVVFVQLKIVMVNGVHVCEYCLIDFAA